MNSQPALARVRPLDVTLANQIAAGEVVERPASVLKELLENALDAGASHIQVHAQRGGISELRVVDDGAGIHHDDLRLALQRHATSKISSLDELESVLSMGFRGEALPSIASVARMQVVSRLHDDTNAWQITAEGGPVAGEPVPASHPPGTSVTMRDLFFNTPVRRRFLRTPSTELRHLERVFRRVALVASSIAMSFSHDGKELLRIAPAADDASKLRRIGRLLGERFAANVRPIEYQAGAMRLSGWLGDGGHTRERNDQQFLFVNQRPVADATVRHAVRLAYGDMVSDEQQPVWLLYLQLDPHDVDVNVHPAKHEVRFRESRMVHDFVRSGVHAALSTERDSAQVTVATTVSNLQGHVGEAPQSYREPLSVASGQGYQSVSTPRAERATSEVKAPSARSNTNSSAINVLSVMADGLVVARRAEQLLLAHSGDLLSAWVQHCLCEINAHRRAPIARPLLLPQRFSNSDCVLRDDAIIDLLTNLGFSVRLSEDKERVVLLAVPECLALIPVQQWQGVFVVDSCLSREILLATQFWQTHFSRLAKAQILTQRDDIVALLAQWGSRSDEDSSWLDFNARSLTHLFASDAAV